MSVKDLAPACKSASALAGADQARPHNGIAASRRARQRRRLMWRAMRERARGVRRTSMYHAAALMMRELWLVHAPRDDRWVLYAR